MNRKEGVKVGVHYKVECIGKDGKLKWIEEFDNLVVNEGLDTILDYTLATGSGGDPPWYVGLKDTGSVVAGDTMSSHAGWAELDVYSEGNRPSWVHGSVSGQSVDNSASKAQFSINTSDDVYGCFLTSDNTKSGSSGKLYGGGDFGAPRSVQNGDTLNVTVTCTASAS